MSGPIEPAREDVGERAPARAPCSRASAEKPGRGAARPKSWLRENTEAIVVAIVLALIIRQYAMEAFVIPTGSMAPTLLGAHVDLRCTNCGKPQSVSEYFFRSATTPPSAASGNATGTCPRCGRRYFGTFPEDAFLAGRAEVRCERCGTPVPMEPLPARVSPGEVMLSATCSNCGIRFENPARNSLWPAGAISRGDRILVDKFSYRFVQPKRFEVAVFKYPVRPADNFIKRLVGLPGETLDIRNGDLFVNGEIARKSPELQATLWLPVHESRYVEKDGGGNRGKPFRAEEAILEPTDGGRSYVLRPASAGAPGWMVYGREVRDYAPYNESVHAGGRNVVCDLRVRFCARLGPALSAAAVPSRAVSGGALFARLSANDDLFEAEVTARGISLKRNGALLAREVRALGLEGDHVLDLWRADERIGLEVAGAEGKLRLSVEFEPLDRQTRRSEVRIGTAGAEATIADIGIFRDIYYLSAIPGVSRIDFPYRVPDDSYFFLGDNSSNSTDSRAWGPVPAGHIVGRAFLVFWPAIPGDFAVRRIR